MKTPMRHACNKIITMLLVFATLLATHPVQAAPRQMSIKRPDLVFKVEGTDLIHIVTIVNQGKLPAGPFLIRVERFNGSVTHALVNGLAIGEVKYVNTFFRELEEDKLVIIADATKLVTEVNEENNQLDWGVGTRVDW